MEADDGEPPPVLQVGKDPLEAPRQALELGVDRDPKGHEGPRRRVGAAAGQEALYMGSEIGGGLEGLCASARHDAAGDAPRRRLLAEFL